MYLQNGFRAQVDDEGRIILPPEVQTRLGLADGAEIIFDETPNGVTLRRFTTQLAKIYIEPTSRCNLACRMCICNSWEEKQGEMSEATFQRLMQSLENLHDKLVIIFGGFGEPSFHPRIRDMVAQAKPVASRVELITNGLLLSEELILEFIRLGLDMIWFSLDRLHVDAYVDGVNPMANIEKLNHVRHIQNAQLLEAGFVFVAALSNVGELPNLLRVANRYGISRYMVTNVHKVFGGLL